jgi:glycosyltransferase involved in cell wall biosynthesis
MQLVWQERPEARLLIAGARTQFTPYLERLIDTHLTPRERARVIYPHNFTETEKPALFAACDIFAYPSSYESFGIAYVEAWAAGKPVVGCRTGAVPSVISEGLDGLLVPAGDPVTLGMALLRLLDSADLRRRLGQAGQEKVHRRYCWEVVSLRWRELYERVLKQWRRD